MGIFLSNLVLKSLKLEKLDIIIRRDCDLRLKLIFEEWKNN